MHYIDHKEAVSAAHLQMWNRGLYDSEVEFLIHLVIDLQSELRSYKEAYATNLCKKLVDTPESNT